jgi:hypothetical protein
MPLVFERIQIEAFPVGSASFHHLVFGLSLRNSVDSELRVEDTSARTGLHAILVSDRDFSVLSGVSQRCRAHCFAAAI